MRFSRLFSCRDKQRGRCSDEDVLKALKEMEKRMSAQFDNLKAAVAEAVVVITAAIEKIGQADSPAAIQAEADTLGAAVANLKAAVEA